MKPEDNGASIQLAVATDTGKVRQENQDFAKYSVQHRFLVVCDGMGGHKSGRLASQLAAQTLIDVFLKEKSFDVRRLCEDVKESYPVPALQLIAGIRLANRRVYHHARQHSDSKGTGTTVAAAVIRDGWIYMAHVGDSRIYRFRNGQLACLTRDHSWLNELIEDREISESEAKNFRHKNVLTRAVGIAPDVKIDLRSEPVQAGDLYLICTDGLYNALADELILSLLSADHGSLQKAAEKLVTSAKLLDGSDNITGALIKVDKSPDMSGKMSPILTTIREGSAKVNAEIDRALKAVYPDARNPIKRKPTLPVYVGAISLIAFLILGYFFFTRETSSESGQEYHAASQFSESSPPASLQMARNRPRVAAGYLALIQAADLASLSQLDTLNGIHVLDRTNRFLGDVPVHSGRFIWVVADSARRIVYQSEDFALLPADSLKQPVPLTPEQLNGRGTSEQPAAANGQAASSRGRVRLSGDFSDLLNRNARIFINDWPLGPLANYIDRGFSLRPGNYILSIRDEKGQLLRVRKEVYIQPGTTVSIEF